MKSLKSIVIIIIIILVGSLIYWVGTNSNKQSATGNPVTDIKTGTQIQATIVQVSTFYNGQDGYSLSIPSGNNSTCVWNWEGGSADIPYSKTTYANTATEKHTITTYEGNYNYKVNCFDDFGNQYVGVFPSSTQ